MIKGRGPKDTYWESFIAPKAGGDVDPLHSSPKFWACANCRSLEPVEKIVLIGKMPLCGECSGADKATAIPTGGVEEIIERIIESGREKLSSRPGTKKSHRTKRQKRRPLKN